MLRGLHKLCDKAHWAEVVDALESSRNDPNEKGGFGEWTPLHLACRRDPPLGVVSSLISAAPASLSAVDINGRNPLHLAAERGIDDLRVLGELVLSLPSSVHAVDRDGSTPLHAAFAASNRESRQRRPCPGPEEVAVLLGTTTGSVPPHDTPEGSPAEVADSVGNLPLHQACDNIDDVSASVLSLLVSRYPLAVLAQNSDGHTPLHLAFLKAVECPPSLEAVQTLLPQAYAPQICRTQDIDGLLLLHCACKNFAPFEVLQTLLAHHPGGAAVHFNGSRGESPIDLPNTIRSQSSPNIKGNERLLLPIDVLEALRPSMVTPEEVEDLNFKSDLLFAAHSDVEPYRLERDRMERMIELIVFEATEVDEVDGDKRGLSPSAASVWSFLCTFPEKDDADELYYRTARRISESVDTETLRLLANMESQVVLGSKGKGGSKPLPLRKCAGPKIASLLNSTFRFVDRFEFGEGEDEDLEETIFPSVLHETGTSLLVRALDFGTPIGGRGASTGGGLVSPPARNGRGTQRTRVMIKFQSDPEKFHHEINMHRLLVGPRTGVVPLLLSYDMERIGTPNETLGDKAYQHGMFRADGVDHLPSALGDQKYSYAMVTPLGNRDLGDIIAHEWNGRGLDQKKGRDTLLRHYAEKAGRSVALLHGKGVVHCNLQMSSFIHINDDLLLSGLDSAVSVKRRKERQPVSVCLTTGISHRSFRVGSLPPEMFTELRPAEFIAYCRYWRSIHDDARISEILCRSPGLDLLAQLRSFLTDDDSSLADAFMERIGHNSNLWNKIKPRKCVDKSGTEHFFAVRCAKLDERTDMPLLPEALPYDLVPVSEAQDIWGFGLIFYKMQTGRDLFHTVNNGNLALNNDFSKLTNWSSDDALGIVMDEGAGMGIGALQRDLIRRIFSPLSGRGALTMSEVLLHPYFSCHDKTKSQDLQNDIIWQEDERKSKQSSIAQNEKEWIDARTIELKVSQLTTELHFKFNCSSTAQWNAICKTGELRIPTAFTILPYPLRLMSNNSQGNESRAAFATNEDQEMANFIASSFVDALLFTSAACQIQSAEDIKLDTKVLTDQSLWLNFLKDSGKGFDYSRAQTVTLCERIMHKTAMAEEVLTQCLESLGGDALPFAKKLIHDTVENYISFQKCMEVLAKAKDAEKAFAELFHGFVEDPKKISRNVFNNSLEAVFCSEFCDSLSVNAAKVESALSTILRLFIDNPLTAMRNVIERKTEELLRIYSSSETLFFYLIDEGSTAPLLHTSVRISKGIRNYIRDLFPSLYLSMKSVSSVSLLPGIASVFGIPVNCLDINRWTRTIQCSASLISAGSNVNEFLAFQQTIDKALNSREGIDTEFAVESLLLSLENLKIFLEEHDPDRNFGGLKRMQAAGATLWVSEPEKKKLLREVESSSLGLVKQIILEATSFLEPSSPCSQHTSENSNDSNHAQATPELEGLSKMIALEESTVSVSTKSSPGSNTEEHLNRNIIPSKQSYPQTFGLRESSSDSDDSIEIEELPLGIAAQGSNSSVQRYQDSDRRAKKGLNSSVQTYQDSGHTVQRRLLPHFTENDSVGTGPTFLKERQSFWN